jgi:hypothetical protein
MIIKINNTEYACSGYAVTENNRIDFYDIVGLDASGIDTIFVYDSGAERVFAIPSKSTVSYANNVLTVIDASADGDLDVANYLIDLDYRLSLVELGVNNI